jgi:hypothetical protein
MERLLENTDTFSMHRSINVDFILIMFPRSEDINQIKLICIPTIAKGLVVVEI